MENDLNDIQNKIGGISFTSSSSPSTISSTSISSNPSNQDSICNYEILNRFSKGANSKVFLVKDKDGQICVLKVYNRSGIDMDFDEIAVLQGLISSNNIFSLRMFPMGSCLDVLNRVDSSDFLNKYAILLPKADSSLDNVKGVIDRSNELTSHNLDSYKLFYDSLVGLKQLHDNNILHLDIKPENILVFDILKHGVKPTAKIADFGLCAVVVDVNSPILIAPAFTPLYRPIETQQSGFVSAASDVYALGVSFMFFFLGEKIEMIQGKDLKIIRKKRKEVEDLRSQVIARSLRENLSKDETQKLFNDGVIEIERRIPYGLIYLEILESEDLEVFKIIESMIALNPADRPSINDILSNPFFSRVGVTRDVPNSFFSGIVPIVNFPKSLVLLSGNGGIYFFENSLTFSIALDMFYRYISKNPSLVEIKPGSTLNKYLIEPIVDLDKLDYGTLLKACYEIAMSITRLGILTKSRQSPYSTIVEMSFDVIDNILSSLDYIPYRKSAYHIVGPSNFQNFVDECLDDPSHYITVVKNV